MLTSIRSDSDPINRAFAVTPDDSNDLAVTNVRLYIGTSGSLKVTLTPRNSALSGDTVTFTNVPVGWFPICVSRVWSTGTNASGILAGYIDH